MTKVLANESRVMLITDPSSAVRAVDATNLAAVGILEHGSGSDSLVLDRVGKDKKVEFGDTIMTAGSPAGGKLPSLFPRNIPIGTVTSVGQNDTDIFKHIQVQPFVDLSSLQSVLVLIPKPRGRRAGDPRPARRRSRSSSWRCSCRSRCCRRTRRSAARPTSCS